jgi:hypothetical protein
MRRLAALLVLPVFFVLVAAIGCTSNSTSSDPQSCAELMACCASVNDATIDQACYAVAQGGDEQSCAAQLAKYEDGGTC